MLNRTYQYTKFVRNFVTNKMSSKPILYYFVESSPCRTVQFVAKEIGLDLELKEINLGIGEHMTPEFLKMNPQHTMPTLNDNGNSLWDSQAISTYLIGKYGGKPDHSLYPSDLFARARIDQRLYFNATTLYSILREFYNAFFLEGLSEVKDSTHNNIKEAFQYLEIFLETDESYLCGDQLTVADLAAISSVTTMLIWSGPLDGEKYPKLVKWVERVREHPSVKEINNLGLKRYEGFMGGMKAANAAKNN